MLIIPESLVRTSSTCLNSAIMETDRLQEERVHYLGRLTVVSLRVVVSGGRGFSFADGFRYRLRRCRDRR